MAPMYESDLLMIPIGRDFFFTDLEQSRLLLDLIETLISRITDITFKIATPSDYFNARFAQSQTTQVYEGDFLPLVSHGGKAWTGFYTTRPFLKKTIYSTQKIARAGEMVQALIKENKLMEYQVSIGFHHDAITGTCRYNVSQDYFARLEKDYNAGMLAIGQAFISVLNKAENPAAVMNPYKVMTIFSPINWVTSRMISFFSKSQYVKIQDGFGNSILSQSVPIQGGFEIYFPYTLASLSFTVLFVNEYSTPCEGCSEPSGLSGSTQVRDQFIGLDFLNGHILRYYNGTKVYDISSSIVAYNASAGGAYMFTPIVNFI